MGDKNKVITIEDKNITWVRLTEYGKYLIDGELIECEGHYREKDVAVKDPDNIRIVKHHHITLYYQRGEKTISIDDYEKLKKLMEDPSYYDEDEGRIFDNIDDEYKYKKFIRDWKPIQKVVETISDPIKLEKINIKYDSGNPFIENKFFSGYTKDMCLYAYNRNKAILHLIKETFDEIGFKYQKDVSYKGTEDEKLWSGEKIEYIVAFGTYLFGDRNKVNISDSVGTLEDMLQAYEMDKIRIRHDILTKYNTRYNQQLDRFPMDELLSNIKAACNYSLWLDVKNNKKSIENYNYLRNRLTAALRLIENFYSK